MKRPFPETATLYLLGAALGVSVLIALFVTLSPTRAVASICSGDSPAFSMDWRDNYWVGSDNDGSPICDQAGQFIVSVQRINRGHGFKKSAIDGYYGPATQDDVEAFQAAHGVTADGLVGTNTWGRYDNHPVLDVCYGSGECYWTYPDYSGTLHEWKQISSSSNICSRKLGSTSFVWFDRTGPDGTNSC